MERVYKPFERRSAANECSQIITLWDTKQNPPTTATGGVTLPGKGQ